MNAYTITVIFKDWSEKEVQIEAASLAEAVKIAERTYTTAHMFSF